MQFFEMFLIGRISNALLKTLRSFFVMKMVAILSLGKACLDLDFSLAWTGPVQLNGIDKFVKEGY